MLEYKEFKEVVRERFKEFLPEEFAEAKVEIGTVNKVNRTLDGLVVKDNGSGVSVSPTIYLNDLYAEYVPVGDLEQILKKAGNYFVQAIENANCMSVAKILDPDFVKERVVYQLINTEKNKELLAGAPHREFLDLSIVYRIVVSSNEEDTATVLITRDLFDKLGFTEDELFQFARENTKRLLKPTTEPLTDIVKEFFIEKGESEEFIKEQFINVPKEEQMYVLSNEHVLNGATSILCSEYLQELAQDLDSDLYVIPSSIHEVIALNASSNDFRLLKNLVSSVNLDCVIVEEVLSDNIYFYDKEKKQLSIMLEDLLDEKSEGK